MSGSDARAKAAARQRARLKRLLDGGQHHLRDGDAFQILGKAWRWEQLRALFGRMLEPYDARDAVLARARADAGQLLPTIRRNVDVNGPYLAAFAEALRGRFGRGHPLLRSFGVGTGSRRKPSAKTRANATATRLQRRAEKDAGRKKPKRRG